MPEIQTKDKLITLEELGEALNSNIIVTGVKGSAESNYRKGNVNLTATNIGAVAKTGDTMTGMLTVPSLSISYDNYQFIYMRDTNGTDTASIRSQATDHVIVFREFTPNISGAYEDYGLPAPTNQSGAVGYSILTTKVCGSKTVLFTDGKYTDTFESFGLSGRPSHMIVTGSCSVANDWYIDVYYDAGASTSNIVLYGRINGAKALNNYLTFSFIAIP